MGLKPVKQLSVSVLLLVVLLLFTCASVLALAPHAPTRSSTPSLRPVTDPDGDVTTHKRALLTTRTAPIGFPPPPSMRGASPPPYRKLLLP